LFGRTDTNKKVVIPDLEVPTLAEWKVQKLSDLSSEFEEGDAAVATEKRKGQKLKAGDYVVVKIESSPTGQTLKGRALASGTLTELSKAVQTM